MVREQIIADSRCLAARNTFAGDFTGVFTSSPTGQPVQWEAINTFRYDGRLAEERMQTDYRSFLTKLGVTATESAQHETITSWASVAGDLRRHSHSRSPGFHATDGLRRGRIGRGRPRFQARAWPGGSGALLRAVTGLVVTLRRRNLLRARVAPGPMSLCQAASGACDAYAGVGRPTSAVLHKKEGQRVRDCQHPGMARSRRG